MVNRRQLLKLSALGTASFAAPLAYSASKITMAYNTGNPPGSSSPKDLIDNAEDFDYLMTGDGLSHPNRLGVSLKSWKGMEAEHSADQARRESEFEAGQGNREFQFNAFMDASGLEPPIAYAPGILLDRTTKTVSYLGNEYRAKSSFIPLTTTTWDADEAKLKLIGDDSLRQDIANILDPSKGVGRVGGGIRSVPSLQTVMSWTGVPPEGSVIISCGYEHDNDGGGNTYIVEPYVSQVTDAGNLIRVGDVVLRGTFPNGRVHLSQYGVKWNGSVNNMAQFLSAREKARELDVFLELGAGTVLLDSFTPANNDKMRGQGSAVTKIKFTTGDTGIHMSNTPYGVRHTQPPAYIKDTKFIGFSVIGSNVNIGIYAVANLFSYWDDVLAKEAKVCNWFNAYIFGGKWGNIRADYGVGSGFEFGYNRFGWTPAVPGEPAALCHGASILHLDCYGNGIGLVGRPPLGSVMGAGAVFADGLSNSVMELYCEQNFGHGLVTVGAVAYSLSTVYLEANDKFRPEGADRYDYYNAAGEMSVGNLGPIFTGGATVWNAGRLVCQDFRGTKIDGPGPAKVNGNYRNTTITNPSLLSVPLLSRFGTVVQLQRGHTLPRSMPADGTTQFFRTGVYRCYPEIVLEGSGLNVTAARVIITKSDGTEVYNKQVFSSGNPVAGMRMVFPLTDFPWDNTQNYRLTLTGVTPYTGDLALSFIADIMA